MTAFMNDRVTVRLIISPHVQLLNTFYAFDRMVCFRAKDPDSVVYGEGVTLISGRFGPRVKGDRYRALNGPADNEPVVLDIADVQRSAVPLGFLQERHYLLPIKIMSEGIDLFALNQIAHLIEGLNPASREAFVRGVAATIPSCVEKERQHAEST